jgi:hypothetical protein
MHPEEFRRQAAALVREANPETSQNRVAAIWQERAAPGGPVSADERAELARMG